MSVVDWVIVAFTALLALRGWSRGFIVSALALAGFAIGALVGTHIGPLVLNQGSRSPYAPLFSLGGALLLGGLLGTLSEGLGSRARRLLFLPPLRIADGLAGAALTACLALGTCWIVGAVLLQINDSASIRHDVRNSAILRWLDEVLPPSGPLLDALSHIDPLPSVTGPSANVAAPDPKITSAAGVVAAAKSVVKITGTACGLGIEGSGWVAGPNLVVTNAHVVAGETNTQVMVNGTTEPAPAVVFDPTNDIAVLKLPTDPGVPILRLDPDPGLGVSAAILGYPEDGGFKSRAGRLGDTQPTRTENAYGDGPVTRDVAALRGLVQPGNSGGPMINAAGQVVATIFAEITNAPVDRPGGFAVPDSVVKRELERAERAHRPVSTESCAD